MRRGTGVCDFVVSGPDARSARRAAHAVIFALLRTAFVIGAWVTAGGAWAGEFGMVTVDTAPSTIFDGLRDDLLRIAVSNPGATGVPDVELTSLGLRLESAPGIALTASQSSRLLNAIEVYADSNTSGVFEPGADALVGTLIGPAPAADGTLSFPFVNTAPGDVRVIAGQSRVYFLVVRLTGNASAQTPRTLRITHVTSGPGSSTAREYGTGTPLTLQPVAELSSSTITALFNNAPTTVGIANVTVSDPAFPTSIPLFASFQDTEDLPAQMSYEISAISNTGLFAFTGIDAATGTLSLIYKVGTMGKSRISIRATDRAGKFATATFEILLTPIGSFTDWLAARPGGGNLVAGVSGDSATGSGLSDFARYSFGLNPRDAGDRAGLLRASTTGGGPIFTHFKPKYAADLVYNYEVSSNLNTWMAAVKGVDYTQSTRDLLDGRLEVKLAPLGNSPKVFLRARVDQTAVVAPSFSRGSGAPFAASPTSNPNGDVPAPPAPGAGSTSPSTAGQVTRGTAVFAGETVLTVDAKFARSVAISDLDGDGRPDVLSASQNAPPTSLLNNKIAWYRGNGNGTFGAQQVITTDNIEPSAVTAADLDGDGRPDVVTGSQGDNKLAWHRNLGSGAFGPQQLVSTNYSFITSVSTPDLDNDGKPDLLCTSLFDFRVAWHRNLGGGAFGAQQVIGVLSGPNAAAAPYQAVAGDIDGDGWLDVISASVNDNKIAWYRNNRDGTFGAQRVISTSVVRASTVAAADFDGDGIVDIACGGANDNTVSFFKNIGNGTFGSRVILSSSASGVFSVIAADLNGDGAPDVVSASLNDNKVAWYENLGGGSFGSQQIISSSAMGAISAAAGDLNGDGMADVVSASQSDSKVAAYRNQGVSGGGQVAVATANTAPTGIIEGTGRGLLRIAVSNRLPAGGANVQLAKLAFLFESSPGVALTTAQAGKLIDRLLIYADTSGAKYFQSAADSLIQTVGFFPLAGGRLQVPLQSGSPELPVPPGGERTFFVVVQLKPDAAAETIRSFRITHVTDGQPRTIAKDSLTGLPVFIGPAGNVSSSAVLAQPNQGPGTTGIPTVVVSDPAAVTSILLRQYFNDAEDGSPGLRFAITGNTRPELFSFAGINPATGALGLRSAGIAGSSQLTVRATDTLGKSVTAAFTVNFSF